MSLRLGQSLETKAVPPALCIIFYESRRRSEGYRKSKRAQSEAPAGPEGLL